MSRLISHAKRMYCESAPVVSVNYNKPYKIMAREQVVENSRVVPKTTWKEVLPSETRDGLKASDFALENIIAAGAVGSLRDCYYTDGCLNLSDAAQSFLDTNNTVNNEE